MAQALHSFAGCLLLGLAALSGPVWAQGVQGYTLVGDHVMVNSDRHWVNWDLPTHAVVVSDGVAPRLFRTRYNVIDDLRTFSRTLKELRRTSKEHAILNIDSTVTRDIQGNVITKKKSGVVAPVFTYTIRMGISRAGSNAADGGNILDGDPTTYWEPDPNDALDDWWLEVDLGRVVAVDSVVVHFVDEELGDPFRQFRILAAPDQEPVLEDARKVDFELVGRTTAPNRDRRQFDFSFAQTRSSAEWTGRMVETLRFVVTDTRAGRGTLVTEEEWEALAVSDRGDIVHFIQARGGFQEPVDQDTYESLAPERRARRDFYRRERPRLADIEVWGWGDNLGPGISAGGGNLDLSGGGFSPSAGFDGDFSTSFVHPFREKTAIVDRGVLTIDLGAAFWIDEVRTSVTGALWKNLDGYRILGSDGTLDTGGQLQWQRLSPLEREDNSIDLFRHLLEIFEGARPVRFMEITTLRSAQANIYLTGPIVAEYQLFTEGYAAEVVLESDLISLPTGRNLGRITWAADTPPGTQLEIRTRSGDQQQKEVSYYDSGGNKLKSAKAWGNLFGSTRGLIDTAFVVGSDWSNWSRSYQQSGELVTSPSQKRFMQVQVKLRTEDRFAAAAIHSLDVELLDPVAERLVAELWPLQVSSVGRLDTFEVFLRSFFVERPVFQRSGGFDEMLLTLTGADRMELLALDVGVDETSGEPQQSYVLEAASGAFTRADGQRLSLLQTGPDSIHVRLPSLMHSLPLDAGDASAPRLYHRITVEDDQVPVGRDGQLLTLASYGLLASEERGDRQFFRTSTDASGQERLTVVDEETFDALEEEERAARYFRILLDEGGQFPFDASGDTLDARGYGLLPISSRGRVVGAGALMRVQFRAPVFVNGTTLKMAVRNTGGGTLDRVAWQGIEPGDATSLVTSEALSIQVPLDVEPLNNFTIAPNPFTPNGDMRNEETHIGFQVFKLSASREAVVRIFSLDGRRQWEQRQMVTAGTVTVTWKGVDRQGQLVPPGIYICQLQLDVDDDGASTTLSQLVHVVY